MAITGTTPDPPATSSSGASPRQTKYPPTGPRSSTSSPTRSSSCRYGETSPSGSRSTVSSTTPASSGGEPTEYDRLAV